MKQYKCAACGVMMLEAEFNMGLSCIRTKEKYAMPKTYQADAWFCPKCGKIDFYARLPEADKKNS
jgi:phage FluMu protein Com